MKEFFMGTTIILNIQKHATLIIPQMIPKDIKMDRSVGHMK